MIRTKIIKEAMAEMLRFGIDDINGEILTLSTFLQPTFEITEKKQRRLRDTLGIVITKEKDVILLSALVRNVNLRLEERNMGRYVNLRIIAAEIDLQVETHSYYMGDKRYIIDGLKVPERMLREYR